MSRVTVKKNIDVIIDYLRFKYKDNIQIKFYSYTSIKNLKCYSIKIGSIDFTIGNYYPQLKGMSFTVICPKLKQPDYEINNFIDDPDTVINFIDNLICRYKSLNKDNLIKWVDEYGVNNLVFVIPVNKVDDTFCKLTGIPIGFTSSSDAVYRVAYKIHPEYKDLTIGNKLKLTPLVENTLGESFPNESFYYSDLCKLIEQGQINVYLNTSTDNIVCFKPIYVTATNLDDIDNSQVIEYITTNFLLRHQKQFAMHK